MVKNVRFHSEFFLGSPALDYNLTLNNNVPIIFETYHAKLCHLGFIWKFITNIATTALEPAYGKSS